MSQIPQWKDGSLGSVDLDASALGDGPVKTRLLAQAVRMYEANQRQGTVKTKTRAETAYTGHKPFKQKGTGNARRGDRNSPLLRGGGVIFGPRPRDYSYALPRKALREALRSALVGKLRDGEVKAMSSSGFTAPSTKSAAAALAGLGCEGSAVLVVPESSDVLWKSFRNLPRVSVVRAGDLNAYDVLWHRDVVFVDDAWAALAARLATLKRSGSAEETVAAVEASS